MDDTLGEIGLSMTPSVYESTKQLRVAEGVYFPQSEILDVWSVDLCDQPLFGGHFLDAPINEKWRTFARDWQKEHIGDKYNA